MTGRHEMFDGDGPVVVDVPTSGGENVMVPVVRAIVRSLDRPDHIILQRRDDPDESVRGLLEIPGGRWRAAESPIDAVVREIVEETGLTVTAVHGVEVDRVDDRRAIAAVEPLVVVAGVEGAFPAAHVILVADARGEPIGDPGESADVRWWHIDAVATEMSGDPGAFIPSSHAALRRYLAWVAGRGEAL